MLGRLHAIRPRSLRAPPLPVPAGRAAGPPALARSRSILDRYRDGCLAARAAEAACSRLDERRRLLLGRRLRARRRGRPARRGPDRYRDQPHRRRDRARAAPAAAGGDLRAHRHPVPAQFNTLFQLDAHARAGLPARARAAADDPRPVPPRALRARPRPSTRTPPRRSSSTSRTRAWADELFARLGLPRALMPELVERRGRCSASCAELGMGACT